MLGIILGGGAGTRLYPLTKNRAKPAVPLGANYRLIDIPVSNCVNSNVTKIYTLTQFNSASLNRHLSQAYVSAGGQRRAPAPAPAGSSCLEQQLLRAAAACVQQLPVCSSGLCAVASCVQQRPVSSSGLWQQLLACGTRWLAEQLQIIPCSADLAPQLALAHLF